MSMTKPAAALPTGDPATPTDAVTITAFEPLSEDVAAQTVPLGTALEDLTLPDTLEATVNDGRNETATAISGVTWESSPEYDPDTVGTYRFPAALPEGYTLSNGVSLPVITVEIRNDAETTPQSDSISGFVWLDENEDGVWDDGESGIEAFTVSLYTETDTDNAAATAVTGANGSYTFGSITPGRYVLGIQAQFIGEAEYLLPLTGITDDNSFAMAVDWENAFTETIDVQAGSSQENINAGVRMPPGIQPLGTISSVLYLDANGTLQTADNVTVIESSTTDIGDGWYVVNSDVTTTNLNITETDVNLILADNCTLTANGTGANPGFGIVAGTKLTIYAQSTDSSTMGKIIATADPSAIASTGGAGIGGFGGSNSNKDCGEIVINSGNITATGGKSSFSGGAGIGGGGGGSGAGGTITITGGEVTATGSTIGTGGAGIGGGGSTGGGNPGAAGGTVTISGSNTVVKATGGNLGNDIGSGGNGTNGGSLEVSGGATVYLENNGTDVTNPSFTDCTIGGAGAENQSIDGCYDSTGDPITALGDQTINIAAPVTGAEPQSTVADGIGYSGTSITWYNVTDNVSHSGNFGARKVYKATVELTSTNGCHWPSTAPIITVPGSTSVGGYTVSGGKLRRIDYLRPYRSDYESGRSRRAVSYRFLYRRRYDLYLYSNAHYRRGVFKR